MSGRPEPSGLNGVPYYHRRILCRDLRQEGRLGEWVVATDKPSRRGEPGDMLKGDLFREAGISKALTLCG